VVDENLRGPLWEALCRSNSGRPVPIDLSCVGEEAGLELGASDQSILEWAEEHRYVVVSSDVTTMPVNHFAHLQAGRHSAGVVLIALPCEIPKIVDALFYYAEHSDVEMWRDSITYIPLSNRKWCQDES
jgi:hypothetical protein